MLHIYQIVHTPQSHRDANPMIRMYKFLESNRPFLTKTNVITALAKSHVDCTHNRSYIDILSLFQSLGRDSKAIHYGIELGSETVERARVRAHVANVTESHRHISNVINVLDSTQSLVCLCSLLKFNAISSTNQ